MQFMKFYTSGSVALLLNYNTASNKSETTCPTPLLLLNQRECCLKWKYSYFNTLWILEFQDMPWLSKVNLWMHNNPLW